MKFKLTRKSYQFENNKIADKYYEENLNEHKYTKRKTK